MTARIGKVSLATAVLLITAPTVLRAGPPWKETCPGESQHVYETLKEEQGTYKETEHYCLHEGKRQGATLIAFTDYTGKSPSTFTAGNYQDGLRIGSWVTRDAAGEVMYRCVYTGKGKLVSGPRACEK